MIRSGCHHRLFLQTWDAGDRDAMVLFVVRKERQHAVGMPDLGA